MCGRSIFAAQQKRDDLKRNFPNHLCLWKNLIGFQFTILKQLENNISPQVVARRLLLLLKYIVARIVAVVFK